MILFTNYQGPTSRSGNRQVELPNGSYRFCRNATRIMYYVSLCFVVLYCQIQYLLYGSRTTISLPYIHSSCSLSLLLSSNQSINIHSTITYLCSTYNQKHLFQDDEQYDVSAAHEGSSGRFLLAEYRARRTAAAKTKKHILLTLLCPLFTQ